MTGVFKYIFVFTTFFIFCSCQQKTEKTVFKDIEKQKSSRQIIPDVPEPDLLVRLSGQKKTVEKTIQDSSLSKL